MNKGVTPVSKALSWSALFSSKSRTTSNSPVSAAMSNGIRGLSLSASASSKKAVQPPTLHPKLLLTKGRKEHLWPCLCPRWPRADYVSPPGGCSRQGNTKSGSCGLRFCCSAGSRGIPECDAGRKCRRTQRTSPGLIACSSSRTTPSSGSKKAFA